MLWGAVVNGRLVAVANGTLVNEDEEELLYLIKGVTLFGETRCCCSTIVGNFWYLVVGLVVVVVVVV